MGYLCICSWSSRRLPCARGSPARSNAFHFNFYTYSSQEKPRQTRTHLPFDEDREGRRALEELAFKDDLAGRTQICSMHMPLKRHGNGTIFSQPPRAWEHIHPAMRPERRSSEAHQMQRAPHCLPRGLRTGIDSDGTLSDVNAMTFTYSVPRPALVEPIQRGTVAPFKIINIFACSGVGHCQGLGSENVLTCKVFYTPHGAAERVLARFKDARLHQGLQRERSSVRHHGGTVDMAPMLLQASHECTNALSAGNASVRGSPAQPCRCPKHHSRKGLYRTAPFVYTHQRC